MEGFFDIKETRTIFGTEVEGSRNILLALSEFKKVS